MRVRLNGLGDAYADRVWWRVTARVRWQGGERRVVRLVLRHPDVVVEPSPERPAVGGHGATLEVLVPVPVSRG